MASLQNRIFKLVTSLHVFLYHNSGGKIWGSMNGSPILMLTTTGSKTGLPRTTPVMYVYKDNEYLITASANGSNQNPTWFSNLNHNPQATIEINGKQIRVNSVITSGDERDKLYENFKAMGNNFVEYEKKTTRKIPVIRLQPITA